ncbi:hypothetical protein SNEBB_004523 [Seison nebaliae]|nr:hypothetical protein SNEBB_004523 [Seison nebaliae]
MLTSHRRSAKLEITKDEFACDTLYLGNIHVTHILKHEQFIDNHVDMLWKHHCTNNGKTSLKMKLNISNGGSLQAYTHDQGKTIYHGQQIKYFSGSYNSQYKRLFVWIYRHEIPVQHHRLTKTSKIETKQIPTITIRHRMELRCHAVLCQTVRDAEQMEEVLRETLSNALASLQLLRRRLHSASQNLCNSLRVSKVNESNIKDLFDMNDTHDYSSHKNSTISSTELPFPNIPLSTRYDDDLSINKNEIIPSTINVNENDMDYEGFKYYFRRSLSLEDDKSMRSFNEKLNPTKKKNKFFSIKRNKFPHKPSATSDGNSPTHKSHQFSQSSENDQRSSNEEQCKSEKCIVSELYNYLPKRLQILVLNDYSHYTIDNIYQLPLSHRHEQLRKLTTTSTVVTQNNDSDMTDFIGDATDKQCQPSELHHNETDYNSEDNSVNENENHRTEMNKEMNTEDVQRRTMSPIIKSAPFDRTGLHTIIEEDDIEEIYISAFKEKNVNWRTEQISTRQILERYYSLIENIINYLHKDILNFDLNNDFVELRSSYENHISKHHIVREENLTFFEESDEGVSSSSVNSSMESSTESSTISSTTQQPSTNALAKLEKIVYHKKIVSNPPKVFSIFPHRQSTPASSTSSFTSNGRKEFTQIKAMHLFKRNCQKNNIEINEYIFR